MTKLWYFLNFVNQHFVQYISKFPKISPFTENSIGLVIHPLNQPRGTK